MKDFKPQISITERKTGEDLRVAVGKKNGVNE